MEQPTSPPPIAPLPTPDALRAHLAADVPLAVAVAAHRGTSHVPERRGQQEIDSYADAMLADFLALLQLANTPAKLATLSERWPAYRTGRRRRLLVYLHRKARCLSPMVTGPARFPVGRNVRANDSADAALHELVDHRAFALAKLRRALHPELAPIASGAADAPDRLQAKLQALQARQAQMVAVNATIRRHAREGHEVQREALVAAGIAPAAADHLLKPDYLGRVGFADFELRNGAAEIRRLQQRLATVTQAKATPTTTTEGAAARLEDAPADNRVRLYFPGKPGADVRATLKAQGFRWAPSLGCWQAYRNAGSLQAAKALAGLP